MRRENRRDALQKCNRFENYRVAHRARLRLGAGMFLQLSNSEFDSKREIVRKIARDFALVCFTLYHVKHICLQINLTKYKYAVLQFSNTNTKT